MLSNDHLRLLEQERGRIATLLVSSEQNGVPRHVPTVAVVADLRSDVGRFFAEQALGAEAVETALSTAALAERTPTTSWLLDAGSGLGLLALLASEFVAETLAREPGEVPTITVDQWGEPELALVRFDSAEAPS
jgi:hypothetical protein